MGIHCRWCPFGHTDSTGSGSATSAYLRFMGCQASYNRESMCRTFAAGMLSGLIKKVTAAACTLCEWGTVFHLDVCGT